MLYGANKTGLDSGPCSGNATLNVIELLPGGLQITFNLENEIFLTFCSDVPTRTVLLFRQFKSLVEYI